ncbi:MAG: phosphatase PAP2 family protein [Planctomycetes bacterium]|nr:phosphatase PAP2 family protein [Planctomycetota bacterium]
MTEIAMTSSITQEPAWNGAGTATQSTSPLPGADEQGFFRRRWPIVGPMLVLVLISLLIRWTDFDMQVAGLFYDHLQKVWPYELANPWLTIYRQGTIPSFVVGIGGAIVALLGRWILPRPEWRDSVEIRRSGVFLGLFLVLGPGLIVNVGFKHLWGRPRPIQCKAFNGEKEFLPVGTWASEPSRNSSFPSGHAAVAFYLMAPGFVAGRRRPRWTAAFFLMGTLLGLGMGLTRIIQGGHFVSDVLWAGALTYLTGAALAWLMLRNDSATAADGG